MSILLKQWATGIAGGQSWSAYWATRKPSNLLIEALTETSIKLDWTANGVEDYDGYSVERSMDGITYAEIDTVLVGTETYTNIVASIIKYYYRVRAYKDSNYSDYCDVAELIYGPELIVNGGFDVNASWDFGGGTTTIHDGKAYISGGGPWSTVLRQVKVLPLGTYAWSFTISEYVSGTANILKPACPANYNANGTYTGECTGDASTYLFQVANGGAAMNFAIDNVSLKKKL